MIWCMRRLAVINLPDLAKCLHARPAIQVIATAYARMALASGYPYMTLVIQWERFWSTAKITIWCILGGWGTQTVKEMCIGVRRIQNMLLGFTGRFKLTTQPAQARLRLLET